MSFPDQVHKMSLEVFSEDDWMMIGPRSSAFCLGEVARLNLGMVSRSNTWRHENNVAEDSRNGQVHELISEALELFICVDQLDGYNGAGVECLFRQLQYVEYEVKKKREAKATPDGSHDFRLRTKVTGGAIIDPALLKWISERAARDSAILKEQRKATEEQALARKGKAPAPG